MSHPDKLPEQMLMTQLLGGFQVSQALYVVAKLGVSTALLQGPRTVEQLAAATGANADALGRVIRALAPVGVFRTEDELVEVTSLGATLAEGQPGSLRDVALFWAETHYAPFGELLHTAKTGENAATHHYGEPFFDWISKFPSLLETMTGTMAEVTRGLKAGMFDSYSLPAGGLVADLGGADGSMICELLAAEPARRGIVFDLPEVVQSAHTVLADRGLADRVEVVAGSFFDSVPTAEVYTLSYIFHDWSDEQCGRILRNIRDAASPGARVIVIEAVIPPGDGPHLAKATDLTMLGMLTGRERTAAEYETLLTKSGFVLDRIVPTSTPFSFVEATMS